MRKTIFLITLFLNSLAGAIEIQPGQRLAEVRQMISDQGFPKSKTEIQYVRKCSEKFMGILTRSQIAVGKNFFEIGVLVQETGRPCQMHEPAEISETVQTVVDSKVPVVLLEMDLSIDLRTPIRFGVSFAAPQMECSQQKIAKWAGNSYSNSVGGSIDEKSLQILVTEKQGPLEMFVLRVYAYLAQQDVTLSLVLDSSQNCLFIRGYDLTHDKKLNAFTDSGH